MSYWKNIWEETWNCCDRYSCILLLSLWLALMLLLPSPPIRTGVFAQVTTSFASGRRPPAASPATRWSRCCRGVGVMWPCWSPGILRVRGQQPRLPHHLLTPPLSPPYPPDPRTCPPNAVSAWRWAVWISITSLKLLNHLREKQTNKQIHETLSRCVVTGRDERVCFLFALCCWRWRTWKLK